MAIDLERKPGQYQGSSRQANLAGLSIALLEASAPQIDLRQQTYDLLSSVRGPSPAERQDLEGEGFVFLTVEAKSVGQVVAQKPDYFWEDQLEYLKTRGALESFVPPRRMEVAVHPERLVLPGSFRPRSALLAMIEDYSNTKIEPHFPGAKAIMLPATGNIQADGEYRRKTGEVLFGNYFAWALDNTAGSLAALVGRFAHNHRLHVLGWPAGDDNGAAVPAVVFLQQ